MHDPPLKQGLTAHVLSLTTPFMTSNSATSPIGSGRETIASPSPLWKEKGNSSTMRVKLPPSLIWMS